MSLLIDPVLVTENQIYADKGIYFVSTNPTPGTPIVFVVNASPSETAGYFLSIKNTEAANGKRVYLDYLRLLCGVVPASATSAEMFLKMDTTGFTGGGSQCNPVNVNGDSATASVADVRVGALTTAARSGSPRLVTRNKLRTVIPVSGDEWVFSFGNPELSNSTVFNGTNPQRMPIGLPPVIIAPQAFALVQLWFPGNAATPAQFEFELGLIER